MKLLFLSLFIMTQITSTFAQACHAINPGPFRKFMNRLVTEIEYYGSRTTIERPTGGTTTTTRQTGSYFFYRVGNTYPIRTEFCSSGEDGQCEAGEASWYFFKGCLYVNGNAVRVRSSTQTELRFDYTRDGGTYRARYNILSGRRLSIVTSLTLPAGSYSEGFLGTGM